MSWDPYIDNLVSQSKKNGTENIDKAIIIDKDSGAPWTGHATKHLRVSLDEGKKIVGCFKKNDFQLFMASGVYTEGIKYQFLRSDGNAVYAKKKDNGTLTIQSTKKTVIVAHCPEGGQQGDMNKAVGIVADYLENLGY